MGKKKRKAESRSQASAGTRTPGVSIKAGTLEPNVPESCMNEGRTKGSTANPGMKKRKAKARSHASAGTRTPGVSIKAGTLEPNVPESCMNEGSTKGSTANPGKKKRKAEARAKMEGESLKLKRKARAQV